MSRNDHHFKFITGAQAHRLRLKTLIKGVVAGRQVVRVNITRQKGTQIGVGIRVSIGVVGAEISEYVHGKRSFWLPGKCPVSSRIGLRISVVKIAPPFAGDGNAAVLIPPRRVEPAQRVRETQPSRA